MIRTARATFPVGGIHPRDNKLSADAAIEALSVPSVVVLPLSQHIGKPAVPVVKPGDSVKVGQCVARADGVISANVHASASGIVSKIDDVLDISGYKKRAIIIQTHGDDWCDGIDTGAGVITAIAASPKEIIDSVCACGIAGLGGATFPTHVKLSPPKDKRIEYVLINGVECEPFLTSDHRLMVERSEEILIGTAILMKALGVSQARIGIEANKPDAIEKFRAIACQRYRGIDICALSVKYPQGGERQLVKALVNREIPPPPRGLPHDVGCAVFNVATTYAVYEAVQKRKPLVERVVTVTGTSISRPSNFLVRIGTPLSHLIEAAGGMPADAGKILGGGPMMGRAVSTTAIPLTKGISGILVIGEKEAARKETLNCFRCAKCVSVCPLGLEPYLLMALAEAQQWEKGERERMLSCCECGCCSYICPANRPLLDYMKLGKTVITNLIKQRPS